MPGKGKGKKEELSPLQKRWLREAEEGSFAMVVETPLKEPIPEKAIQELRRKGKEAYKP